MKFSLLNFNTFGTPIYAPNISLRYKKICEIINKEKPDVICLQEIATYYHLYLLKKYLKNYPHFIYKNFTFGPKGGLVIISKIPTESYIYKPFKTFGSLKNLSFYSNFLKNGILVCKFKNLPLTLANTHTVTDFEYVWSPTNRYYNYVKSQIEQIAREVINLEKNGEALILTGDFNMKKNSRLHKYFLQQTKTTDVFGDATIPTYYKERLDYRFKAIISTRIDFVFLKDQKKKIKVLSKSHMFDKKEKLASGKLSYLSDHIGLKVEIEI